MRQTYGTLLPGMKLCDLAGKLIVIEGTDGAGRTTQINLLRPWLEELGHAVLDTGDDPFGAGRRRNPPRQGRQQPRPRDPKPFLRHRFRRPLENEIVPALRAGFVVLTDRYIYSLIARAMVRGVDPVGSAACTPPPLKPDAVFYLRLGMDQLIPRVIFSRGFDYWESGMGFLPGPRHVRELPATTRGLCWRNLTA